MKKHITKKIEKEESIDYPLAGESRAKIITQLNWLLPYIDSKSEKEAVYLDCNKQIDAIITEIVTIARARKTREEKNAEETSKEV
ncbi:MAG: hypothetical protein HC906_13720 [Bacteroidales bacterium]|nr:hypothetical protein [Bacteroidales bacterium]